jgi:hypothetical protein
LMVTYALIMIAWGFRFPISYRITHGTYGDLVLDHNFTRQEMDSLEKAYHIRLVISKVLLYSSVLMFIVSWIIHQRRLFEPRILVKIIMIISGLIACVLILVNGINFIPGPPLI